MRARSANHGLVLCFRREAVVETRAYFVVGDLLSTCAIGTAVGGVTGLAVPAGWSMPMGMITVGQHALLAAQRLLDPRLGAG